MCLVVMGYQICVTAVWVCSRVWAVLRIRAAVQLVFILFGWGGFLHRWESARVACCFRYCGTGSLNAGLLNWNPPFQCFSYSLLQFQEHENALKGFRKGDTEIAVALVSVAVWLQFCCSNLTVSAVVSELQNALLCDRVSRSPPQRSQPVGDLQCVQRSVCLMNLNGFVISEFSCRGTVLGLYLFINELYLKCSVMKCCYN
jgi:hypothetical protein